MPSDASAAWGHGRDLTGRVHTLAVGRVALLRHGGLDIPSAIRKIPVTGTVMLSGLGLAGDEQADSVLHGGPDKAVSVYPWEHYAYWAQELGLVLGDAAFGENVTSVGLLESEVFVGDVFDWGQATVQVSQPRRPCFKVGARYDRGDLPAAVERTRRTGFYLRVLRSGRVAATDALVLRDVDPVGLSVADVMTVLVDSPEAAGLTLARVLLAQHLLPPRWVAELDQLGPGGSLNMDAQRRSGTGG